MTFFNKENVVPIDEDALSCTGAKLFLERTRNAWLKLRAALKAQSPRRLTAVNAINFFLTGKKSFK